MGLQKHFNIKISICFEIKNKPRGGGNQFLKALKEFFERNGVYAYDSRDADIILYNSYQYIAETLRRKKSKHILVHRIDGPIRLYNTLSDKRDGVTNIANRILADGTIFQSKWSRVKNYQMGLKPTPFASTIPNAPDPDLFNHQGKIPFSRSRKIRLVATSWSSNWSKGFAVYKWMDENIDLLRYEMSFIGTSPVKFHNIRHVQPMPSKELAEMLKMSDIFITASQNDPCSNSLIEAMHCGLPAIALNDGGHPEIVRKGGELFDESEEMPDLLEKIVNNYYKYQNAIDLPTMDEIGQQYLDFMQMICEKAQKGEYSPKQPGFWSRVEVRWILFLWKLSSKWRKMNLPLW